MLYGHFDLFKVLLIFTVISILYSTILQVYSTFRILPHATLFIPLQHTYSV